MIERVIVEDISELAQAACARVVACIDASVHARGRCMIALSGGSTPRALYRELARHPALPWPRVHLCFGDERAVAPDDPRSNARMVHETLGKEPFVPPENVHRMRGELPPVEAARAYEAELRRLFPDEHFPRFDLVLLGLGQDGHTASLFPGSPALNEQSAWVVSHWVASQREERLTLTFPVLNSARVCVFLVAGTEKAWAVREVLEGQAAVEEVPARGVDPAQGTLTFMLDRASAAWLR